MKSKLVLLHGALGGSAQFDQLKTRVHEKYEVYSFDFKGHGKREACEEDFSITLFTEDVLIFLAENKIEVASFFGYSMGGYVALNFALHYPEKVKRIVTLGTKFNWTPENSLTASSFLNPEKIASKVPAYASYLQKIQDNKWKQVLEKTAAMLLKLGISPELSTSDLAKIKHMIRCCVGDKDATVTTDETDAAVKSLKNAELIVFADTPHEWEQVKIEKVVEALFRFIH